MQNAELGVPQLLRYISIKMRTDKRLKCFAGKKVPIPIRHSYHFVFYGFAAETRIALRPICCQNHGSVLD